MSDRRYSSPAWRYLRGVVLRRDGYRCQLQLPGCTGIAQAVDHTIELFEGGEFWNEDNLSACCKPCNSRKHMDHIVARQRPNLREW